MVMTPCSRPENLDKLRESIPHEFLWAIFVDKKAGKVEPPDNAFVVQSHLTGHSGNPLRNEFLDMYAHDFEEDDWVYILDDDNIMHPDLAACIKRLACEHDNCGIVTWASERLEATSTPREGNIDTASYMFRPYALNGLRFQMNYGADGVFAQEASKISKIATVDKVLCYYNYLRR